MNGYIYITTNLINGKKYIGRKQSETFLGNKYLGSGVYFKKAVEKHGAENFSVELIESCSTYEELVERETYYIKLNDAVNSDKFYNESYGGFNEGFVVGGKNIAKTERARKLNSIAHRGKKMPDGFSEKQRQLHLGKPSGMLGKKHSQETKAVIGAKSREHNLARDSSIYKKVSETATGNKMMHKDNVCIRVHPENFDRYVADGWIFGGLPRKPRHSRKQSQSQYKSAVKGRKWIHKNGERKYVYESELPIYMVDGWLLGMK